MKVMLMILFGIMIQSCQAEEISAEVSLLIDAESDLVRQIEMAGLGIGVDTRGITLWENVMVESTYSYDEKTCRIMSVADGWDRLTAYIYDLTEASPDVADSLLKLYNATFYDKSGNAVLGDSVCTEEEIK